MKRTSLVAKALRVGAFLLSLALPVSALAQTLTVVSDSSWEVFVFDTDGNRQFLGLSQNVCLGEDAATGLTYPETCPVGDTPPPTWYGYKSPGWTADLSGLPTSARWIWANKKDKDSTSPPITGASSPAAFQEFIFETDFYVCEPPPNGTMFVAVDDYAEVSVNGTVVPNSTSTKSFELKEINIPSSFLRGSTVSPPTIRPNRITVKARNGPNPEDCANDKYECNPAGVVLAASFENAGGPPCPGWNGGTYYTGQEEKIDDCPDGQYGGWYHRCVCGQWLPKENKCVTRPQCTGTSATSGGMRFDVDAIESQTCPAGQSASPSSHKCLSSGNWDVPLGACMAPPVVCTDQQTNGTFAVGQSQTRDCQSPRVGTESRTCRPTGQFGNWSGVCTLPFVGIGEQCGSRTEGATGQCPSGTSCGPRVFGSITTTDTYCDPDPSLPMAREREKCGSRTQGATASCRIGSTCRQSALAEAYCDPNTSAPLPLGASCSASASCGSGRCDAGFNTTGTNICTPLAGRGLTNDPCTNNNQCRSGTCNNLRRDASGRWIPGQCR